MLVEKNELNRRFLPYLNLNSLLLSIASDNKGIDIFIILHRKTNQSKIL